MKGEIMLYTDNRQNKIEVNEELINIINEVCEKALKAEEVNIPYQISLLFVDNEEIRDINRETRGIDKAIRYKSILIWNILKRFIRKLNLMRYI